jgi:hypothetical protein
MATAQLQHETPIRETHWESRTYVYYSRYPAIKPITKHRTWRKSLRRIGNYLRLSMVGAILVIVGGICPLLVSYELVFKPLVDFACNNCQVVSAKPYFEFNYIFGSILGVFGLMMPIFVAYIFIRILRSRSLRHDLFR